MFSNELVCDILEYINNNINKEITIDELSEIFFFNKTYIMKRFKSEIGLTIHSYINHIRIFNSLFYFKNDSYILNIAIRNGFNSLEYFSETFKNIIGVNPRTYKKFISHNVYISKNDYNLIVDSINKLEIIKNNSIRYLNNRKPKEMAVKKFIFR